MPEAPQRYAYPGYDVLAKRNTPSWNEQTRAVVAERLRTPPASRFFDEAQWRCLVALCARVLPQPTGRERPVPLPEMIDARMVSNCGDGFRMAGMPPVRDCWTRGLGALDAEAWGRSGTTFAYLLLEEQDALLRLVQRGEVSAPEWDGLPAEKFFSQRVLHDVASAYYAHPTAWSEMGFGGPASPRGYVRMGADERDPWDAAEVRLG